jgi:hypothetical protein
MPYDGVMPLRLRVTYGRVADFLADVREQVARGGLLARVDVGSVERGSDVELDIFTPAGAARPSHVRVLHVLGPSGVAVELAPAELADLAARAEAFTGAEPGTPPVHEQVTDDDGALSLAPEDDEPAAAPAARASTKTHAQLQTQKIQEALHGDKNQRMAILREQNRLLVSYVLKNPQVGLEEILFVAKNATSSPDNLTFIGNKREWFERSDVAIALVRNPKTPVPVAVKLLDFINPNELRLLAKPGSARDQISSAARKKIMG